MTRNLPANIMAHDEAGAKAPVSAPELSTNSPRAKRIVLFESPIASEGAWIDAKQEAFEEPKR